MCDTYLIAWNLQVSFRVHIIDGGDPGMFVISMWLQFCFVTSSRGEYQQQRMPSRRRCLRFYLPYNEEIVDSVFKTLHSHFTFFARPGLRWGKCENEQILFSSSVFIKYFPLHYLLHFIHCFHTKRPICWSRRAAFHYNRCCYASGESWHI